jgi:glycosyltransferase involved in cell wall biosynthesis
VLFIGHIAYSGGTFTFFDNASAVLQKLGWKVDCVTLENEVPDDFNAFCRERKIKLRRIQSHLASISLLRVAGLVRNFQYSLVIGSGGGLDFYDLLFALPVPVFHFLHTVVHKPLAERDLELLRKFLCPDHRLIAVSKAALDALQRHAGAALPPQNARYLYNFVRDRPRWDGAESIGTDLSVVTIGHVTGYKNPWLWIDTARKVIQRCAPRPVRFTWVGSGDLLKSCREACADEPAIEFVGFHRDVDRFLSRATLLFHPSMTESFGLTVAEAMMFGKPVVVSDAGALPELVEEGVTGRIFPLAEPLAAVECLVELLDLSEGEREVWGQRARQRYERLFTEQAWKLGMETLLTEVGLNGSKV